MMAMRHTRLNLVRTLSLAALVALAALEPWVPGVGVLAVLLQVISPRGLAAADA